MAGASVKGDFATLRSLVAQLDGLPDKQQDIYAVLMEDARKRIDEGFARSVSPGGAPWRPLAPRTIARRRKRSSRPLLDTGRLRASITYIITADGFVVGTSVIYAATHQHGRAEIPARPFLPHELPAAWAADWREQADVIVRVHFGQ